MNKLHLLRPLFIGLAMLLILPKDSPLITAVEQSNKVLHKILSWALFTAPLGIFAIMFEVTLKSGGTLISSLFSFCQHHLNPGNK